jgi:hypothetical protein
LIKILMVRVIGYGACVMDHEPSKKRRATYQDVIDAPEHMVAEIIGGELRLADAPLPTGASEDPAHYEYGWY